MSIEPRGMDLKHVTVKKLAENVWLVGWMFQTQKSGEDTVRAIADLYHAFDAKEKDKASAGEQSKDAKL